MESAGGVFNVGFGLAGMILYTYTIMMLRRAIAECDTFQFKMFGTYTIGFIFVWTTVT